MSVKREFASGLENREGRGDGPKRTWAVTVLQQEQLVL